MHWMAALSRERRPVANSIVPFLEQVACFSYFEFKIRLIRLSLSFQKHKFPVRSHNHYNKEPTVSGRHMKAFSSLQLCLTDFCWIQLILLIKLIQYKKKKNHDWMILVVINVNSVEGDFRLIQCLVHVVTHLFPESIPVGVCWWNRKSPLFHKIWWIWHSIC